MKTVKRYVEYESILKGIAFILLAIGFEVMHGPNVFIRIAGTFAVTGGTYLIAGAHRTVKEKMLKYRVWPHYVYKEGNIEKRLWGLGPVF